MSFKDMELASEQSYYKLVAGENQVRIVSEAIPVWTAFDRESTTGKKSRKFLTREAAEKYNSTCTDENKLAKVKYAMWIIDRKNGDIVMAEFGTMIMQALKALANDSTYGFEGLPPYDLRITKTGEEKATRYSVLPLPAKPLTEVENRSIEAVGNLMDVLVVEAEDGKEIPPAPLR